MTQKIVGAARFKADCLRLIDEMALDRQPVTITKRGRPVAVLTPASPECRRPLIGALKGSVLRFDEPFTPAASPEDWTSGS